MAILKIASFPDPVLQRVGEPVVKFDHELKALAEDMFETMYAAEGVVWQRNRLVLPCNYLLWIAKGRRS